METEIIKQSLNDSTKIAEAYFNGTLPSHFCLADFLNKATEEKYPLNRDPGELLKTALNSIQKQLSSKTLKIIKANYDRKTRANIYKALINFSGSVIAGRLRTKILPAKAQTTIKQNRKASKELEIILQTIPLSNSEKSNLQEIKQRCDKHITHEKEIKLTASEAYNLYMYWQTVLPIEDRFDDVALYIKNLYIKHDRGGPERNIYLCALVKVIYQLLTIESSPALQIDRYKDWAKSLTKDIINEAYKHAAYNLSPLSLKDIKNIMSK